METRAHYVLIGAVVMIVVACAFWFVLWIGSGQREYDTYDIVFRDRVTGLSTGSIVRFNGIQKGEVRELSIDKDDPSIVIARVRVEKGTPIKVDTRVELEPVGFTGLAIIQFVGGTADAPTLLSQSKERIPKMNADAAGIALFLESSGDVITRANAILSDKNIQAITDILAHVETTTGAIAENGDEISALISNASEASENFAEISTKLDASITALEKLLSEDAPNTLDNTDATLAEAALLLKELQMIAEENRESIKLFADNGLGQVAPALSEARTVMRSLDSVLREIERDPKAFFLGEATPEYEAEKQ